MTSEQSRICRIPLDHAFAGVRSGATGLGDGEAARRIAEYGHNRIEEHRRPYLAGPPRG